MAKEVGVVKSVAGGAKALNNITGEVRILHVGDIVYQNEKITTDSLNSKVVITRTDGKDMTMLGKDTLTLDQSTSNNESFGNETITDILALQQAILKGTDLDALKETAAGGSDTAVGGDGVSLSSASFTQGGHISNINANVGNINPLSTINSDLGNINPVAAARGAESDFSAIKVQENDLDIARGDNTNEETAPTKTPFGDIELSSSFYSDDISIGYFSNLGTAMHNAWLDSAEGVALINDAKKLMKSALENVKQYHDMQNSNPYDSSDYNPQNAFTAEQIDNLTNEYIKFKFPKEVVDSSNSANLTNTNNLSRLFDTLGTQLKIGQKTIEIDGHKFQKATASIPEENIEKIGDSGWGLVKNAAGEPVAIMPVGKIKTGLKLEVGDGEIGNEKLTTTSKEEFVVSYKGVQKIFTNLNDVDNYIKSLGGYKTATAEAHDPWTGDSMATSYATLDPSGNKISCYPVNANMTHTTNLTTLKLPASTLANLKVFGSDGDDTLILDGVTVKAVYGGSGADNITINNSTITEHISGDAGNDNITVNNSTINGKTITNSDGLSSHEAISGNSGQDTISVANSNITGNIEGSEDADIIKILDGTLVEGNVNGGSSKQIFIDESDKSGADRDNINVIDSTVKGDVKGGSYSGNDVINIKNSDVGNENVFGGYGDNIINISNSNLFSKNIAGSIANDIITVSDTTLSHSTIRALEGNDTINIIGDTNLDHTKIQGFTIDDYTTTINIKDNANLNHTDIEGKGGKDTINIGGNTKVSYGTISTGSGANDEINISGNAEIDYTMFHMGGDFWYYVKPTDKATLNVTEDAVITNLRVEASAFSPEMVVNLHQNGKAEVSYIRGNENKDVVDIAKGHTVVTSWIELGRGNDEIKIHDGATAEFKARMGSGEDKLTIENATLKDSNIRMGYGNNEININAKANLSNVLIESDDHYEDYGNVGSNNDTVNIRGGKFNETKIRLSKYDGESTRTINIDNKESGEFFGDQDDSSYDKTSITARNHQQNIVNIKDGSVVKNTSIKLESYAENIINIEANATVQHSKFKTDHGNDTLNINGTVSNATHFDLGNGDDTLNMGNGAVVSASDIHMDRGHDENRDIVNIGNDATIKDFADIKGGYGMDTITVGDNLTLTNSAGIHGDWGNNGVAEDNFYRYGKDHITIGDNLTMSQGSIISGGEGNDIISIGKNAKIDSSSTIDGGSGSDTLIISDSSVDFSNVKNFEKLALGGKIQSNGLIADDNTDVTLKLTTDHVKDILRGSDTNTLKIYGNSGDQLNIKEDFKEINSDDRTFKVYESISDPSIKIEIQDQVHVI